MGVRARRSSARARRGRRVQSDGPCHARPRRVERSSPQPAGSLHPDLPAAGEGSAHLVEHGRHLHDRRCAAARGGGLCRLIREQRHPGSAKLFDRAAQRREEPRGSSAFAADHPGRSSGSDEGRHPVSGRQCQGGRVQGPAELDRRRDDRSRPLRADAARRNGRLPRSAGALSSQGEPERHPGDPRRRARPLSVRNGAPVRRRQRSRRPHPDPRHAL